MVTRFAYLTLGPEVTGTHLDQWSPYASNSSRKVGRESTGVEFYIEMDQLRFLEHVIGGCFSRWFSSNLDVLYLESCKHVLSYFRLTQVKFPRK